MLHAGGVGSQQIQCSSCSSQGHTTPQTICSLSATKNWTRFQLKDETSVIQFFVWVKCGACLIWVCACDCACLYNLLHVNVFSCRVYTGMDVHWSRRVKVKWKQEDEGSGENIFLGNDTQPGVSAGLINYHSSMRQEPFFFLSTHPLIPLKDKHLSPSSTLFSCPPPPAFPHPPILLPSMDGWWYSRGIVEEESFPGLLLHHPK